VKRLETFLGKNIAHPEMRCLGTIRRLKRASADAPKSMPSTHISFHSHIVFATKDRIPSIKNDWRNRLHAYLGGIAKGAGATPLAIGGTEDHVHLLIGMKSSHRIDYLVRDIKADSSEWIHHESGKRLFQWQKGYRAFSISPSNVERVRVWRVFNAPITDGTYPDVARLATFCGRFAAQGPS
jgi:putative transposase